MKKFCLVAASSLTMIVVAAAPSPAAAATTAAISVPAASRGVFCKIFPRLCA
ncbi:hypothetical protein [uncultured Friedmanniella sp.]|uniref:hypothetical protein n=1 Tax=uncultured Friedmanniella sp. TaxID=335381 RepID=UPI0035C9E16F